MSTADTLVIKITVINHPGVMSHVTGLFSRRGFNLEGILCGRIEDGSKSIMYLLVNQDEHLEQIVHQLEKLYDVEMVTVHDSFNESAFTQLDRVVGIEDS